MKQFRASSAYSIMAGGYGGITDKQQQTVDKYLAKDKLTDIQKADLDMLLAKKDAPVALTPGAISYVEKLVDNEVYGIENSFSSWETQKGQICEDESIELVNQILFKNYKKSDEVLSRGYWVGHPDIIDEDEQMIIDIKTASTKESFLKHKKNPFDSTYEFQVKCYLYMKGWTNGRVIYTLVDTPEELIPTYHDLSLHECGDLPLELRYVYFDVELTEMDIKMFDVKGKLASDYYKQYKLNYNV